MADMFTEITIQSVSAFIGGGAVAAIPPIVQLVRRRRRGARDAASAADGVVIFPGSSLEDVEIDNSRHVDNRRYTDRSRHVVDNRSTVITNITESRGAAGTASGASSTESTWLIVFGMLVAAALFANYYVVVSWFALGLGVGFGLTATLGVIRALRWKLWDRRAAIVLAESALAVTAVIWTWVAVFSSEHDGSTLETLRAQMAVDVAQTPITPGPLEWPQRHLLVPIGAFVNVAIGSGQMIFLISLFGAFVLSFMVMLFVWVRLYNWYVYLGFLFGVGSEGAAKRAARHTQLTVADLGVVLIMAAIAIFFASGMFVGLADAGVQAPVPVPTGG
ncbi:hypothetical protein HWD99_13660 [Microbacterium sp. C5A9]|uniref:hypothetical protein n=1 Tax=Microbacterium sp. C5A9 TaxID=2736663 RepID=UPI001F518F9D|nr:hypothetical protein [Microbacterium sp. C5A9]MCI1019672.1 hypothetical protein [Microbacterium sp. C5A9]